MPKSSRNSGVPQIPPAEPVQPAGRERPAYDNERYWTQRLEKDFTLAAVGHPALGLAFNRWAYRVRRAVLLRTLHEFSVEVRGAQILELGFGTGFYLDLWRQLGAAQVTGFDITEIAVSDARARYPAGWTFDKADIAKP